MPAYRVFLRLGSSQRPEKVEPVLRKIINMESLKLDHLTENEIVNVNGGWLVAAAVGALFGALITSDLDDLAAAGRAGWEAAK